MIDNKKLRESTSTSYTVNTLANYETALDSAKSTTQPNRTSLLMAYDEALTDDAHLSNLYKMRIKRITGLEYTLTKGGKRFDLDGNKYWFDDVIAYIAQSIAWGNSLIQINKEGDNVSVELINRYNVIPERKEVKSNMYSYNGDIDYSKDPYTSNLIDVNYENDPKNLGEFVVAARLAFIKREALLNWSEFLETYLQPIAAATTDSTDATQRRAIEKFLKTLGRKKYLIKDSNTKVEFIEANGAANVQVFENFISVIDDQMSEALLGATMLTKDGSSYSQAEVHTNTSFVLTKSDIRFVDRVINTDVIPKLIGLGIIPNADYKFTLSSVELLTPEQQLARDQFIIDNFDIDASVFADKYNLPIKGYKVKANETGSDSL